MTVPLKNEKASFVGVAKASCCAVKKTGCCWRNGAGSRYRIGTGGTVSTVKTAKLSVDEKNGLLVVQPPNIVPKSVPPPEDDDKGDGVVVHPYETDLIEWCVDDGCTPKTYADLEAEAGPTISWINEQRLVESPGSSPLQWNDNLAHAAVMHAIDHLRRGYNIKHDAPAPWPWGEKAGDRARNSGYVGSIIGENIGVWIPGADDPDMLLERAILWQQQHQEKPPEGHHINNMAEKFNDIGMVRIDFPECMNVGPGYLNFNDNPNYLLNPYNHYDRQDIPYVEGEDNNLTQWIWGRSILVYVLGSGALEGTTDAPPLPNLCTMEYPPEYDYPPAIGL